MFVFRFFLSYVSLSGVYLTFHAARSNCEVVNETLKTVPAVVLQLLLRRYEKQKDCQKRVEPLSPLTFVIDTVLRSDAEVCPYQLGLVLICFGEINERIES